MEQFGQFREKLAEELKEAPKEDRKEVLDKAKQTPEYWQSRTEKLKERQSEEKIDNGLGVLLKKKTLYHGSGISGIEKFNEAEEDTVGNGVYFTSEARGAIGYAHRRSRRSKEANPVIYECSVEDIKLCDLRKGENAKKVLDGFRTVLVEKVKDDKLPWYYKEQLQKAIDGIKAGIIGFKNLREATFSTGKFFSNYIKSLGYDGLIALEGGEGNDVGDHDTYLIFDPEKVKINSEQKISK